jgi:hypothetical protein
MDYLRKKLYIPLVAIGLALSAPSCRYKNIEEAYDWCERNKKQRSQKNKKIQTTKGKLTCEEITDLFENEEI